jgi:hypothetical protein
MTNTTDFITSSYLATERDGDDPVVLHPGYTEEHRSRHYT